MPRQHRTSNDVEGWDNRIKYILGRPNPELKDVILRINGEAETSAFGPMRAELDIEGKKRKILIKSFVRESRRLYIQQNNEVNGVILSRLKTFSNIDKLE